LTIEGERLFVSLGCKKKKYIQKSSILGRNN